VAFVGRPSTGAIATFIGTTRDHHEGRPVAELAYEAHAAMAVRVMRDVCRAAAEAHPGLAAIYVAHRTGTVPVGEASVLIAVSSPHRAPALAAATSIIDDLKARVPIWKQERYADGSAPAWKENKEWHAPPNASYSS
jgi:molybdopterin synthase catalytic subunit